MVEDQHLQLFIKDLIGIVLSGASVHNIIRRSASFHKETDSEEKNYK